MPQAQMDATDPVPASAGWRTSEFWLAFFGNVIGALITTGVIVPGTKWDKIAGVAMIVLTNLGYTAARVSVKAAAAKADSVKFAATKGVSVGPSQTT